MKSQKGFTLIELLVVISIISLLASLVLGNLNGSRMKARNMQRVRGLLEVQKALELYAADNNGLYPPFTTNPAPSGLLECWECTKGTVNTVTYDPTKLGNQIGKYLNPRPSDPSVPSTGFFGTGTIPTDNRGYWYQANSTRTEYKIIIFNTIELPRTPTSENDVTTLMIQQGIPQKLIDTGFDPSGTIDASISVYSSAKSKCWSWFSQPNCS